jgi:HAD superfamily hydrolase (TIGR01450 family)
MVPWMSQTLLSDWLDADGFAIDLDGTLIRDGTAIEGADRLLHATAGRFVIVSNNSTDTASGVSAELAHLGLAVPPECLVLAGETTLIKVAEHWPDARILLLAAPTMQRFARELGLGLVAEEPDIVVLARDPRFTYRKLATAANALRHGARLIVTNPDGFHPGRGNSVVPETGALMQALVYASGVEPDEIIGKPAPALLEQALRRLGTGQGRTLMIGDNPATDGAAAARLGMSFLLLGESSKAIARTPAELLHHLATKSGKAATTRSS